MYLKRESYKTLVVTNFESAILKKSEDLALKFLIK